MARLIIAALLAASGLFAVDLTGTWTGSYPGRNNDPVEVIFKFTMNGTAVSGKLYGDYRSSRIVEGTVSGNLVTFVVLSEEQAGNQINETRIRFTGSLKGDELELIRERETSTNAGNKGGVQFRGNAKQVVKLKRLF